MSDNAAGRWLDDTRLSMTTRACGALLDSRAISGTLFARCTMETAVAAETLDDLYEKEVRPMHRTVWKTSGLAIILALACAGAVQAQQHQQHHQRGPQASEESAAQAPMMYRMQGMMEHMQDMMEHMQDMTGQGGMMGMMGRGGMMGHGHKMLRMLDRLTDQLDLTDQQETQIRTLVRNHMKQAVQARADIAAKRIDLQALLDADTPDLSKVKDTLQAIASRQADLRYDSIALMQEVKQLLTPEQQQQFRTLRRQMWHGRGAMMGYGGMYGGQGAMMGRGGRRGPGGMRNPCGTMGRGRGAQ
jgi:Spy/CpxP family protein refolding chaperone